MLAPDAGSCLAGFFGTLPT